MSADNFTGFWWDDASEAWWIKLNMSMSCQGRKLTRPDVRNLFAGAEVTVRGSYKMRDVVRTMARALDSERPSEYGPIEVKASRDCPECGRPLDE